ncbi:MAG: DUF4126 domain-containing protein [Luteolibacter sp.]|jgi:hypothetical protein
MTLIEQLGTALGLASLAGINLYLTVLIAGLAVRFNWLDLAAAHESLAVVADPWVISIAAIFFVIEFFADKVPWLDSLWDTIHTVIRPAGGIFLGLAALGELSPTLTVIAVMATGGAALSTHGTKAGVRAILNMSPEPVSNSVASVTEDGLVLGGLGVIALAPGIALFLFILVVIACTAFTIWLWHKVFRKRRATALA